MAERLGKIGTALITGVIVLEGCGGQSAINTFTSEPTRPPDATLVVPTIIPSPTDVFLPSKSPDAMAKPTPSTSTEVTPTPEATPFVGLSIVDVKKLPIFTPSQIKTEIEKAYTANPMAEEIWKKSVALKMIYESQFGTPGDPYKLLESDRLSAASLGIVEMYDIYNQTHDIAFYKSALDWYGYAIKNIRYTKEYLTPKLP
jgi:hypothetical protein